MKFKAEQVPFSGTGYFSGIITAYLAQEPDLRPFYQHSPDHAGIAAAIEARKKFTGHRAALVTALEKQYRLLPATSAAVEANIRLLGSDDCFSITTAHQPVIFTGTLYFIYKILHVIRLSRYCKEQFPQYDFVPVFYMGSEDADLDELGTIWMNNEKISWSTTQTGAVGRMHTDGLEPIMSRIEGELAVQPHGPELLRLLRDCYGNYPDIQTATFALVDALFARYGLVVLIPDAADLKALMQPVFEDDLFRQTASRLAEQTIDQLGAHYKVQANPRAINLFYLTEGIRNRIVQEGTEWLVDGTTTRFTEEALRVELQMHPERFSPNVILRGLFQETILPNLVFVGGGGELAYWMELKAIFTHYQVPYPVLLLRNSFLVVPEKWADKIHRLGFAVGTFFKPEQELLTGLVKDHTGNVLQLEAELDAVKGFYQQLKTKAGAIDHTLEKHIEALRAKATRPLYELEKKMLRAEKRKYKDQLRQIQAVKAALFPGNSLQERRDNFMPYYAMWGSAFIDLLYENSPAIPGAFVLLEEQ